MQYLPKPLKERLRILARTPRKNQIRFFLKTCMPKTILKRSMMSRINSTNNKSTYKNTKT